MRWRLAPALGAAATFAFAFAASVPASAASADHGSSQSEATTTPIKHLVTVMQENHTFDNYFGTYGNGSDGLPSGTCMPVNPTSATNKTCVQPYHIGKNPSQELDHNARVFANQFNNGKMDGFVSALSTGGLTIDKSMAYYDGRDIPYYWNLADEYVLFDRFFTSAGSGSISNHMYWVAGTPGSAVPDVTPPGGFDVATIFDRLEAAGVSWKFYVQNYDPTVTLRSSPLTKRGAQVARVPLLAFSRYLDNPDLMKHIVPIDDYFRDLDHGTLPAVSYVVPSGTSEQPPSSVQSGQGFVRSIVDGLQKSRAWSSSAFLLTYDSWGGWYDHVTPPAGLGFRPPALLVSPYARRGLVDHTALDFTSILHFIEQNWSVAPLTARDAAAADFASAFDFSQRPRPAVFVSGSRQPLATSSLSHSIHVVYVVYGAALVTAVGFVLWAVISGAGRRRIPANHAP